MNNKRNRYYKIDKYILSIDLLPNSIHDENRTNIIDAFNAKFKINKFKILEIENMITHELLDKLYLYKIGDSVNLNIYYFYSRERAFFELDYDYFIDSYSLIDKLYYINYYRDINIKYCGIHRSWYDSGQLKEEFYHINGILEGKYKSYYENGLIEYEYDIINNNIVK